MREYYDRFRLYVRRPEGFFVVVTAVFGVLFALLIPPFQTPDEDLHLYRAYEVAELKVPQTIQDGRTGSYLPASIAKTRDFVNAGNGQNRFLGNQKYDIRTTKGALLDIPLNRSDTTFYNTSSSPAYFPLMYAPQAIVVAIANLFQSPVIVTLYLVRLAILSIWIFAGYVAIRLMKWRQWTLAGVCVLPFALAQSVSPGLDVLTHGAALLYLVLIARVVTGSLALKKSTIALLVSLSVLMIFGKSTMAVFFLLLLLVPRRYLRYKYPLLIKLGMIAIPVVAYFIWLFVSRGWEVPGDTSQMQSFLGNPLDFLLVLANSLFLTSPSGLVLHQSLIGNFGWLDTPVSPFVIASGYVLVGVVLLANYEKMKPIFSDRIRNAYFGAAAVYCLGVFLAMYLYVTPVDSLVVVGVQGRYFFPLVIIAVIALCRPPLVAKKRTYVRLITYGTAALLFASVATIILRYYVSAA